MAFFHWIFIFVVFRFSISIIDYCGEIIAFSPGPNIYNHNWCDENTMLACYKNGIQEDVRVPCILESSDKLCRSYVELPVMIINDGEVVRYTSSTVTANAQCNTTIHGVKRFGRNCLFRCHCLNSEQCDFETGFCESGCSFEWTGPGCQYKAKCVTTECHKLFPKMNGISLILKEARPAALCLTETCLDDSVHSNENMTENDCHRHEENIAFEKPTHHMDNMVPAKYSDLSNDSDNTTCSFTDFANSSRSDPPWLAVSFPNNTTFKELDILTKDDFLPYFSGFSVTVQNISEKIHTNRKYLTGDICYQHGNSTPRNKTIHVKCTSALVGNQIRVQLSSTSTQLVVCDFRVYGECRDRIWGSHCQNECGLCYNLEQCDSIDGHCPKGCELGYKKTTTCASGCVDGFYGNDCKKSCSSNCVGGRCDRTSGTCLSGCVAGWNGSLCNEECRKGYWDKNCQRACGKCVSGSCNRFNGTCSGICQPGYKYKIYCDEECDDGTFGTNCSGRCNNCFDVCAKTNGHCDACKPGWHGTTCSEECSKGHWGKDCHRACGKCVSGDCDRFNGKCSGICQPGYKYKDYCDEECDTGWYGYNCSNKCSSDCKDLTLCRKSDGLCLTGSSRLEIFVFVGGALALAVIIIVGIVSILCIRRHMRNRSTNFDNNTHIYVNAASGHVSTARGVENDYDVL